VAPISINFTFLNYFYKTHGIIQTAINQPVLDGLRGGVEIHSDEMDEDDIKELQEFMEEMDILDGVVGGAATWARLFGGGAIVINDGASDFSEPLLPNAPLRALTLYPAARWELGSPHKLEDPTAIVTTDSPWEYAASRTSEFYSYYGMKLHKSRVLTLTGREAPWMVRWMLQGWGMSEIERMIEAFNLYIRTTNVLYDLLNEAKVDVFMIDGLRETLMSDGGNQKMLSRIATVQAAKNMNNALLMDKNDLYEQKQLTFTGIAEVMKENKMGIAAALRMPISKIFGVSSTGFSSGEDDIENYNAMVESDVRNRIRRPIRQVIDLCMRYKWGTTFDYTIKFKPLRVMSAKDEEEIRERKFNRVVQLYDRALMDSEEVGQALQKDVLVSVDTKAGDGKLEDYPEKPMGSEGEEGGGASGGGGSAKAGAAEGKPKKPKGE
jgi:phage-related protein (TIGR01555 family)